MIFIAFVFLWCASKSIEMQVLMKPPPQHIHSFPHQMSLLQDVNDLHISGAQVLLF